MHLNLDPYNQIKKLYEDNYVNRNDNDSDNNIIFKSHCPSDSKSDIIKLIQKKSNSVINFQNSNKYNIIVVDDELFTRQANLRMLRKAAGDNLVNFNFIEAEDGFECLYLAYKYISRGYTIECILSDQTMSYMNGNMSADILNNINRLRNHKHIPFYIITAYEDPKSIKTLKCDYIDDIIVKPLKHNKAEYIIKCILDNV